jgi:hypothetical protein
MRPDSDIDVLVVRDDTVDPDDPTWGDQVDALAREVTAWTGNDTRMLEFSAGEVQAALATGDPVLLAARDEGIVLHGSHAYLKSVRVRRRAGGRRG